MISPGGDLSALVHHQILGSEMMAFEEKTYQCWQMKAIGEQLDIGNYYNGVLVTMEISIMIVT